jgi:hypothetical protein
MYYILSKAIDCTHPNLSFSGQITHARLFWLGKLPENVPFARLNTFKSALRTDFKRGAG